MLTMGKSRKKKQEDKLALAAVSKEMEKPRMTQSARELTPLTADSLVMKNDADQRTVDSHPATVVVDES